MLRFKPVNIDLETSLKAFIPDYIPAVGEVDAFLKPNRPDSNPENLGLITVVNYVKSSSEIKGRTQVEPIKKERYGFDR